MHLPEYIIIHPLLYVSHTISYVEQPEGTAPAVPEKPARVLSRRGEEHTIDGTLSHQKREIIFQLPTFWKEGPRRNAFQQPTNLSERSDENVKKYGKVYSMRRITMEQLLTTVSVEERTERCNNYANSKTKKGVGM